MDPSLDLTETRVCELKDSYLVEVDHGIDFEEMIRAGFFNDIHPDIVPPAAWVTSTDQKETINITLPFFERAMTDEEILAALKAKRKRPINLIELLALGAQHSEVQWECPVVAFGSRWRNRDGDQGVAYLWYNPFGRALLMALIHPEKQWQPFCRFAAVPLGE